MTENLSKITAHMVASLDGFIAKKNGDVSWMETSDSYEEGVDEDNVEEFLASIDCYVIGSKTYETTLKLGWPYGDTPTVVLTHRDLCADRENIEFYNGDLTFLVNQKLKPNYKNIWLCGGSLLIRNFLRAGLVDEISLSILPILIGDGIPFFNDIGSEQALHLIDARAYRNGIVSLCYDVE